MGVNMQCKIKDWANNVGFRFRYFCRYLFSEERKKFVIIFMVSVFTFFLLLTLCRVYFVDVDIVRGNSMEPAFKENDILLVRKYDLIDVKKDDVVIVSWIYGLKQSLVKRIVAMPGDYIRIDEDGLFINDEFVAVIQADSDYFKMNRQLLDNEYYLLGDNLSDSVDSRIFGPCVDLQIRGIVITKLF